MKKITLGFAVLAAASLFVVGCNKKTNEAPVADMEFESAKDATAANAAVIDLENFVAIAMDVQALSQYFAAKPGSAGTVSITPDTTGAQKKFTISFTNSVVCLDGKSRNGDVVIDYSPSNFTIGGKFYRRPGFVAKVTTSNYWVDGYYVTTFSPMTIKNTNTYPFNPSTTNATWEIDGYLSVREQNWQQDSSRNVIWKGTLKKTLINSNDPAIFHPSMINPINWVITNGQGVPTNGAKLTYTGKVEGVTRRVVSYKMEIDETKAENALYRDFTCAPDKVLAVTTNSAGGSVTHYSEWHPIIGGVASFTSLGAGTAERRIVDYGDGNNNRPCDNSGVITIKGISYPIDFRK